MYIEYILVFFPTRVLKGSLPQKFNSVSINNLEEDVFFF